jgi:hypothetical protein
MCLAARHAGGGGMTQFLLNQQSVSIDNVDPNLTVLNWLRNDQRRCGT